jgi:tetraacyldisaccharide 4'-kinase
VSNGKQRCAEAAESGDEPSQLASKLDNVVIVVDEDRGRAAQNVISEFGVQAIILDDGFQHRYLHRDLNICVVPADELSSFRWLLPAGNGREPFSSLQRAGLTVVSRSGDEPSFNRARGKLTRWTRSPVAGMKMRCLGLRKVGNGNDLKLTEVSGRTTVAFSGIGNPSSFEQSLRSLSIEVLKHQQYPDHHLYSPSEVGSIAGSFKKLGADFIVTTEKDIARLKGQHALSEGFFEMNPVYYLDIEAEIVWQGEAFRSMIAQYM